MHGRVVISEVVQKQYLNDVADFGTENRAYKC